MHVECIGHGCSAPYPLRCACRHGKGVGDHQVYLSTRPPQLLIILVWNAHCTRVITYGESPGAIGFALALLDLAAQHAVHPVGTNASWLNLVLKPRLVVIVDGIARTVDHNSILQVVATHHYVLGPATAV